MVEEKKKRQFGITKVIWSQRTIFFHRNDWKKLYFMLLSNDFAHRNDWSFNGIIDNVSEDNSMISLTGMIGRPDF